MIDIEHLMCQILFDVESKYLGEVLLFISVLEEDFTLVIHSLYLKELFLLLLFLIFFFLFFLFWCLISSVFDNFYNKNLIWLNYSLEEHFIIDELLAILLPVLLLKNIGFDIYERSNLIRPHMCTIIIRRQ